MKKKLSVAILVAIVLICSMFSVAAVTDTEDEQIVTGSWGDNISYTIDLETKTLTLSGNGAVEPVYTLDTSPLDYYFENGLIKTVIVEEGITEIKTLLVVWKPEKIVFAESVNFICCAYWWAGIKDVTVLNRDLVLESTGLCKTMDNYHYDFVVPYENVIIRGYWDSTAQEYVKASHDIAKIGSIWEKGETWVFVPLDECTHSRYEEQVVTPPTCVDEGVGATVCSICEETLATYAIPATGHIDELKDHLCDVCRLKLSEHDSDRTEIITQPTSCTSNGITEHFCSYCGAHMYYEYTHLPHTYEWRVVEAPGSCVSPGLEEEYCTVCGWIAGNRALTDPDAHCDSDDDGICDLCGETLRKQTFIEKITDFFKKIIDFFKSLFSRTQN